MIGIFIALLSGALMSIQGVFNTEVTERTSIWVAGAFVQLTALIVCLAAWGITDRSSFMELKNVEPKYMLLGGAIGAFINAAKGACGQNNIRRMLPALDTDL